MHTNLSKVLPLAALIIIIIAAHPHSVLAGNKNDAAIGQDSFNAPMLPAVSVNIKKVPPPRPNLAGASCGTIGPQAGNAEVIIGVNTAGLAIREEAVPSNSGSYIWVVNLVAAAAIILVLRDKKAEMWMLGLRVACVTAVTGLLSGLLSGQWL